MNKLKRILALTLALCMLCSFLPAGALAAETTITHMATKPADGTVSGQPFDKTVSENHRIPGLVTHKGMLIAAADARWDNEKDGGGMDIVVSRSTDGGKNWDYTFPAYLGDNGNVWDKGSSTMMDPLIISDGNTLYLFYDLYPAGYSISTNNTNYALSETGTGFDDNGNLLLSTTYRGTDGSHYLKDGLIYPTGSTDAVDGYTVDGWFNVYLNGEYQSNLFFSSGSGFYVYPTSYVAMQTSADGAQWSDPQLLDLKPEGVSWNVLGPGSGLVTSDNKLAFTTYRDNNANNGAIALVYGTPTDGWNVVPTNLATNESSIVELSDGTIRAFVKRQGSNTIAYVDFTKSGEGYTVKGLTDTGEPNFSNCMVSSLLYSGTYRGKDVVLVCCPSDSTGGVWNGRFNGKIYAFALDQNNNMTKIGEHQINNAFFAYSGMAEFPDGTIGLLYEDGCLNYQNASRGPGYAHIAYTRVDLEKTMGITFDDPDSMPIVEIDVKIGETVTLTDDTGDYSDVELSGLDASKATVKITGADILSDAASAPLNGEYYISDGKGNYLTLNDSTLVNSTDINTATKWNITPNNNNTFRIKSGEYYVALDTSVNPYGLKATTSTSGPINHLYSLDLGFYGSSTANEHKNWIFGEEKWCTSDTPEKVVNAYLTSGVASDGSFITVTGVAPGTTSFTLGNTKYTIRVTSNASKFVDVTLKLGETKTITDNTDYFVNATGNLNPDNTIAGMELSGVEAVYTAGAFALPGDLTSAVSGYYIIKNSRAAANGAAGTLVSNTPNSTNNDGLKLEGKENAFGKSAVWYITASGDNSFTIQDTNGQYMTIGNSTASVGKTETVLTYSYNEGSWKYAISKDGYYLNQFGGQTSTRAAGWKDSGASTDAGSQFEIYRFTGTLPSTEITFKGVSLGETIAVVGDTQYNITVEPANTVEVPLKLGQTHVCTDETGNYTDRILKHPDGTITKMTLDGENHTEITITQSTLAKGTYLIEADRAERLVNTTATNNKDGLLIDGTQDSYNTDTALWTITPVHNGYTVQDANGKYMKITDGNCELVDDMHVLSLNYRSESETWTLSENDAYLNQHGGETSTRAAGWTNGTAAGDPGSQFNFYAYKILGSTEITFEGFFPGKTIAVVGNTQYNITVEPANIVEVPLMVGETYTHTDTTGNYADEILLNPDDDIAEMTVTGETTTTRHLSEKVSAIESGKTYVLYNKSARKLMNNQWADASVGGGGSDGLGLSSALNNFQDNDCWTIKASGDGYTIQDRNGKYLSIASGKAVLKDEAVILDLAFDNTDWTIAENNVHLNNFGGNHSVAAGWSDINDTGAQWEIYEVITNHTYATDITFKGNSEGKTTAIVGTTQYNITVTYTKETIEVNLYPDTKYVNGANVGAYEIMTQPDGNIATVKIINQLTPVSAIKSGKQYLIANKANGVILTNTAASMIGDHGQRTGLDTHGMPSADSTELWTITASGDRYTVVQDSEYLRISGFLSQTDETETGLILTYTDNGWTIADDRSYASFSGHDAATYYLSDNVGEGYPGIALGTSNAQNPCIYWDIYEITPAVEITGVDDGETVAIVGNTQYNIKVTTVVTDGDISDFNNIVGEDSYTDGNTNAQYRSDLDMAGKKVTKLTISEGASFNLNVDVTNAKYITWQIADPTIATVNDNGVVTGVKTGETTLTATVIKDGIRESISIPVVVKPSMVEGYAANEIVPLFYYIGNIDNTTPYYTMYLSTESNTDPVEGHVMQEVIEGEVIWMERPKTSALAWLWAATPDVDHALVLMSSSGSVSQYYPLKDSTGALGVDYDNYYKGSQAYYNIIGTDPKDNGQSVGADAGMNWDNNFNALLENTISDTYKCDGACSNTRYDHDRVPTVVTEMTFISDPVPVITKTVDGVLPITRKQANYRRYADNMVASINEQVYFKITVSLDAPTQWMPYVAGKHDGSVVIDGVTYGTDKDGNRYSAIEYSNALVSDTVLPGAFLYTKEIDNLDGKWDGNVDEEHRKQEDPVTDELNKAWTAEELQAGKREIPLYLVYTIQDSDLSKPEITNTANLTFGFQSHYSTGVSARSANAEAKVTLVGMPIDNVVIDFGQSFTYTGSTFVSITDNQEYTFDGLTDTHLGGAFVEGKTYTVVRDNETAAQTGSKAVAKYGTATVTRIATGELDESGNPKYSYTVTYTPTSILQTADTIQIFGVDANNREKLVNTILVYPASTVYYEEGFLEKVNGWGENTGSKATMNQTFELLGLSQYDTDGKLTHFVSGKSYPYGYDPIYDGISENGEVADSSISSNTVGDTARFTFTGTGFELYADCSQDSGFISVEILDKTGKPVKLMIINTVVKGGNSGSTSGQSGSMGSLPIVSINNLEHDTYTVKLTKVMNDNKVVTIDGVRIFNTVADTSIYTIDLEDNPEFYQMRDAILNAINIQDYLGDSMYQEDLDEGAGQVFAGISGDSEAPCAIITGIGDIYTDAGDKAPQDMLDNGPKNEVYLWPGQTLTFNVKTNRTMQIGLKAPVGPTEFSANSVNSDDTDSASVYNGGAVCGETDMFYYLVNKPVENAENVYTISVTNAGENILAVTNLKVCDDPSAALAPLTEENVRQILINAGYTEGEEPETPDEPLVFEDVPEDAYFHDAVVWAVKEKITNGMSATKFGPELNCTRAQAVTFLWSAAGKPAPTTTDIPFVDVAKDSYFYNAVLWAVENGITSGTDATHFSPEATCTRAQIVTFLYHAFDDPAVDTTEQPFSDVPVGAWCTAPITWAVENGITSGVGDGKFGVSNICNRAQIVTFLYKAYN